MNKLDREIIIEKVICFVKERLKENDKSHDWSHVERVWKNSKKIAEREDSNLFIVELGALLHDIADSKFNEGNEEICVEETKKFLGELDIEEEIIYHVVKIIENHSFSGGNVQRDFKSKELDIVQDADRLDGIGAIGIARTFHYGGRRDRPIYDPKEKPRTGMTKEEYRSNKGASINHFYEKLLLLKDKMNTETGKKMAEGRHRFMEEFLEEFYKELDQ